MHTPGPWIVQPYVDAIDILAADGSVVAAVADRPLDAEGMPPANARLIAACPTMLDALKAAHAMLVLMGVELSQHEEGRRILAAIAAAEGETK